MVRSRSAVVTAVLFFGMTSLASAQAVSDSTTSLDLNPGTPAAAADTSLAREIAMGDSIRAMLAQDDSQTQVDQAQLDSLQGMLKNDRSSTPRAAAVSRDQAAVVQTRHAIHQDLARDKHARARLTSIEREIKKAQAPVKKAQASSRPAASSR
ncbi:MAG: hypothetical protein ACREOQ_10545 [Gemmatimonadales bacterium]